MRLTKNDRYSLNQDISILTENELRDVKFGLNFRWIAHTKKGHVDAANSAKDLANAIRAELARRVQDRHLNEAPKA